MGIFLTTLYFVLFGQNLFTVSQYTLLQKSSNIENVRLNLQNNSFLPRKITLISYQPEIEGNQTTIMWMLPMTKRDFSFQIGTKLYLATPPQVGYVMSGKNLSIRGDTPFWIVKREDQGRTIPLFNTARSQRSSPEIAQLTATDLEMWIGNWQGKLTYLDYSSSKLVSIRTNLKVQKMNDTSKIAFDVGYEYPDEPNANSKTVWEMSEDGKIIVGEKLISKKRLSDGTLQFITEKIGEDNKKPATFRFTYLLNRNSFSKLKQVRYNDASDYLMRNQYEWQKE